MKAAGLRGISRVKVPRTTVRAATPDPRPDLVEREFTAPAPDHLWVADITYVKTHSGWVNAAFVLDAFSRRVVGWQLSRTSTPISRWMHSTWESGADSTPAPTCPT